MKQGYFAIVLLLVFIVLALSYEKLTAIDELGHTLLFGNTFFELFSWFGNTKVVVGIVVIMVIWQLVARNLKGAVLVVGSVGGAILINQVLKRLFERPRPEMVDQLESFSFPSAHAMMSMSYILVLAFLIVQHISNRSIQRILYGWALLLVVCIGLSRIALGHHFVTDIIAGWSLASAWTIGWFLWYEGKLLSK